MVMMVNGSCLVMNKRGECDDKDGGGEELIFSPTFRNLMVLIIENYGWCWEICYGDARNGGDG